MASPLDPVMAGSVADPDAVTAPELVAVPLAVRAGSVPDPDAVTLPLALTVTAMEPISLVPRFSTIRYRLPVGAPTGSVKVIEVPAAL